MKENGDHVFMAPILQLGVVLGNLAGNGETVSTGRMHLFLLVYVGRGL